MRIELTKNGGKKLNKVIDKISLDSKNINVFFKSLFRLAKLYPNGVIIFSSNPAKIINDACDEIEKLRESTKDEVREALEGDLSCRTQTQEIARIQYFIRHHGKKR